MRWLLKAYSVMQDKKYRNSTGVLLQADLPEGIIYCTEFWQHRSERAISVNLQSMCKQWQALSRRSYYKEVYDSVLSKV
jgi:predicted metal-dependent HD superfamily phosphohydrolase